MKKNVKDIYKDFYTVEDAINFTEEETRELQLKHLNSQRTLLGNSKYFKRAEGAVFIDENGDEHLDMIGAVGVATVGNNNEFVWEGIKRCFDERQFMMGVISYRNVAAAFAHNLSLVSPGGKLTKLGTAMGGAEAVEGMIKLIKLATRNEPKKSKFLATHGAFHGKTSGAVSLGGRETWREHQQLDMSGFHHIPYGDADALEEELSKGIYKAFVVEPIQGEGGVNVPPEGYLKKARELCTKYDAYLVVDEIQTGGARTGKMWCCEHEGIIPDCIVFGKGFAAALVPFAGYNCTEELYEAAYGSVETCFHHTATYQENTLSAAAGLGALQYMIEHDLPKQAAEKGEYLMKGLREIQKKYPEVIKEVRGKGLMIGVEFNQTPEFMHEEYGEFYSIEVEKQMADVYRVQVMHTFNNPSVFRFLPPAIITYEQLDYGLESFEKSVAHAVALGEK